MNLTTNFQDSELGVAGAEQRLFNNATFLCETLLEPIRAYFANPVRIHDGYRDPSHNNRVGGKETSWHLFINSRSAADFDIISVGLRTTFDWIRLESKLPFDKVILETDKSGIPQCIHLQVAIDETPRRQAYIGNVGNAQSYKPMEVV